MRLVTAQDQASIDALNTGQRSLLLISVSSLNALNPHLESIWLATYFPTSSDVRLLSIYPTGIQPITDFEAQLVHFFGLDKKAGQLVLKQDFVAVLENDNYWWSGYIILDEVAMADIFDLLGGIEMKGQTLSGEQVIAEMPSAQVQPRDANSYQTAMFQSACKRLARLASDADLAKAGSLLHHHIFTDLQSDQLEIEIKSLIAGDHQPACKFPMLEKSQIVH